MAHRLASIRMASLIAALIAMPPLTEPASASPAASPSQASRLAPQVQDDRLLIHGEVARRADNGRPWVVRCVAGAAEAPGCRYRSLGAALEASAPGDLVLVARGADLNLRGTTLSLKPGVQLLAAGHAPVLPSQRGPIRLASLLPKAITPIQNGVLHLASGNRVVGLNFQGVSLRSLEPGSVSRSVEIRGNHFLGSFTDTPGGLSPLALPTLWLQGGVKALVVGNWFERPEVRSLRSALGRSDASPTTLISVCGSSSVKRSKREPDVADTCLSGNAIRLDHIGASQLLDNRITEALDEAIRIENPRGPVEVTRNQIEAMRQGPDSNMQAAIFTRVSEGHARVSLRDNVIDANATGLLEPADGPRALRGGLKQVLEVRNLIDPIEIGLCRGDQTFPRADDKYGDPAYGSGDCAPTATLSLEVVGNHVRPGRLSDADGIDYNIGMGGKLVARTMANDVSEIGEGNSSYTVDLRGNGEMQETIRANHLVADTGISLEIGNLSGVPENTGRLTAAIDTNTIVADSRANARVVAGKPQGNDASGVEIEVQGSNSGAATFAVSLTLRNNTITVTNQADNPASEALGLGFGSELFQAKDGTVLQSGRLNAGSLALKLAGNTINITRSSGSGLAYGLNETIEQGHFQRRLTLDAGNIVVVTDQNSRSARSSQPSRP